ncbi:MAG TPA: pepsin/retropepsin-like aspartic protease family protein [Terriglobia bacterium]|nr:pepsin/retropepsin-like aspartic protease family protein [Terriglobia bacterium]
MAGRFAVRIGALALLLVLGWVCTFNAEAKDHTIPNKDPQAQEIRIRLERGYLIFASGSIGTADNLNFLIDTGTVPTLVSRRLAQRLTLQGTEAEVGIWGTRTKIGLVTLPVLQIGPVKVDNLTVFAIDMQPVEQELGTRLDAIIGLDALSKTSLTIDYIRKVISFELPTTTGMVVPMEFRDSPSPYVLVPVVIEGKQAHLLLDTGAGNLTLLDLRLKALGIPIKTPRSNANTVGSWELIPIQIRQVQLGNRALRVKNTFMRPVAEEALRDFDGMVGPTSLGIKRLTMNFQAKQLYIELRK